MSAEKIAASIALFETVKARPFARGSCRRRRILRWFLGTGGSKARPMGLRIGSVILVWIERRTSRWLDRKSSVDDFFLAPKWKSAKENSETKRQIAFRFILTRKNLHLFFFFWKSLYGGSEGVTHEAWPVPRELSDARDRQRVRESSKRIDRRIYTVPLATQQTASCIFRPSDDLRHDASREWSRPECTSRNYWVNILATMVARCIYLFFTFLLISMILQVVG